jgi:hypothetical protein
MRVSRGGQPLDLRLVGVVAGDRTVSRMWIDSAGGLFAIIGSGPVTIKEGFEWAVPELIELQDSLIAPQMAAAARRAWQRSDGGLAITGANVIDVEGGGARAGMTVVVQGQRITGIGPDGTVPIPADARMIDATGKSLLPGLWDMHRHVSAFAMTPRVGARSPKGLQRSAICCPLRSTRLTHFAICGGRMRTRSSDHGKSSEAASLMDRAISRLQRGPWRVR